MLSKMYRGPELARRMSALMVSCSSSHVGIGVGIIEGIANYGAPNFNRERHFSSKGGGSGGFRPRRRPNPKYRPVVKNSRKGAKDRSKRKPFNDPSRGFPVGKLKYKSSFNKAIEITGNEEIDGEALAYKDLGELGPVPTRGDYFDHNAPKVSFDNSMVSEMLRKEYREREIWGMEKTDKHFNIDAQLRMADYLTAERGSTEDLVGERKYLNLDIWDKAKREDFMQELQDVIDQQEFQDLDLDVIERTKTPTADGWQKEKDEEEEVKDSQLHQFNSETFDENTMINPNQLAHGPWGELVINVNRVIKVWRGGRLESYRALVIGGNLNGCGGFGVGKSSDPIGAVDAASRQCKRNIFFVDRYQNNGITSDLVGKQNSCRVNLRQTQNGLRGNPLCQEILKRFGITNCQAKAHGNRNPYNVVRATFKALMTHESLDDIALKRGKRMFSLDRMKRLRI